MRSCTEAVNVEVIGWIGRTYTFVVVTLIPLYVGCGEPEMGLSVTKCSWTSYLRQLEANGVNQSVSRIDEVGGCARTHRACEDVCEMAYQQDPVRFNVVMRQSELESCVAHPK